VTEVRCSGSHQRVAWAGRGGSGAAGLGLVILGGAVLACARNASAPSTALTLFPPAPTVQVGGNVQLRADPARGPLQWSSSDTTIVVVQRGLAQGIGVGSAIITATDGTDSGSSPITVTPSSPIPSLASSIQPIFTNYCASCHTPPGAQENIDLSTAAASYANLVNHLSPSTSRVLVVPSDTTNSYLYSMLRGTAIQTVDDMPQGCTSNGQPPCLPAPLIQLIATWILAGANP
jgi:hypothetical protein